MESEVKLDSLLWSIDLELVFDMTIGKVRWKPFETLRFASDPSEMEGPQLQ